eukprot:CAMPEP_0119037504 /NCGR_PEP_ID=MMETSP1177-20130426/5895_1 /TAXON_ID=2985 /ORGANISM="Ochromonas sp, Strain CCMP1899" /LENGTH=312 /DNA_ID=CAMNT_0006998867 /DNA_START=501 /DNA_END=1439 /DNA_ORIENTATION=-
MLRLAQSVATRPFLLYSNALDTHPIKTKCLTSGIMYSGGDIIAQWGENYNNNLARRTEGKEDNELEVNWKRAGIFFVFGTFLGGPAYHYWFNYLDELPAMAYRLKALRERGKILESYAFLKSKGIEVHMDISKLPNVAKLDKWKGKAIKIAADQLIFSTIYTFVFFMSVGGMTGAVDKFEQYWRNRTMKETTDFVKQEYSLPDKKLEDLLLKLRYHIVSGEDITEQRKIIDSMLQKLKEKQAPHLSWGDIFNQSFEHTKSVYIETYLADCIIWPPLQFINFTFVPLRYQSLYVNICNLGWNTFLSIMANKSH